MTRTLKVSLLVLFLLQLVVATRFELAHDEAYYWLYSRHLDWGYFDHPPFVAVVIRLFSFLPHSEIAVRSGFIVLQLASLWLTIRLTGAALLTALLFFSFPLASFAGILALPDMPLLFMTTCYFVLLKKYLQEDSGKNSSLLGLCIAALFYAKYHGVLVVFFTILAYPRLMLRKSFYLSALTALVAFFPHLWWQYQHQFATLRYHFLERPQSDFLPGRSLEYLLLQLFLAGVFVGPLVWFSVLRSRSEDVFHRALKFVAVGSILFFLVTSFNKRVEANWTIFTTVPLVILSVRDGLWTRRWARITLMLSCVFVMSARLLFLLPVVPSGLSRLGEFRGWKVWAGDVAQVCGEQPILANTYQVAAKLSFYLNREIGSLNYHSRKNQFDIWRLDKTIPTKDVCYITNQREFQGIQTRTPEGKTLRIVKNQSLEQLWELKSNQR